MQEEKKLKRYLIRCCYWYYVKSKPLISDRAFDNLLRELRRFENGAADEDSPTQMIYGDREAQYTESWMKTKHNRGYLDAE